MARKRLISPQFFTNADLFEAESVSGLPLRIAYAGLWTVADRRGIFKWSRNLKPEILPYDACDILPCFDALERAGFVRSYEISGKRYGWIPSFSKHQTFHVREAASDAPEPPWDCTESTAAPQVDGDGSTESLVQGTALAMPSPTVAVAVTGTGAGAGAASTTTTSPAPRKKRAARASGEVDSWLAPIGGAWESVNGAGSFPYGQAARELKPLIEAGHEPPLIARRLAWYLRVRGLDTADPDPAVIARTRFTPNLRDFRLRFGRFDPDRTDAATVSAVTSGGDTSPAPWATAAAGEWTRRVGIISVHRIERDLGAFVSLYADIATAERVLLLAIKNYDETCARRFESPAWPDFVRNIQGHVPRNQKAPARVA